MKFGGKVGGQILPGQTQRVEVGGQMAAHAIGADQDHRPDGIGGSLFQVC